MFCDYDNDVKVDNKHFPGAPRIHALADFIPAAAVARFADPGDLIEIDRKIYSHWGLYVGDGYLIHVTEPQSDISVDDEACVKKCRVVEVAGGCRVRVNNKEIPAKHRGVQPLPVDVVVQRAHTLVNSTVDYNLLTRNCEHYVTEWRFGLGWSDQALTSLSVMTMFNNKERRYWTERSAHLAMLSGMAALFQHSKTPSIAKNVNTYHQCNNPQKHFR